MSALSEKIRAESIEEMKHADHLIERILHLEGVPNLQRLEKVKVGEKVPEQFKLDLDLEVVAVGRFNRASGWRWKCATTPRARCSSEMLVSEEEHLHWLETQIELLHAGRREQLSRPADPHK